MEQDKNNSAFAKIIKALKSSWYIALSIILLSVGIGFTVAFTRKPEYVATQVASISVVGNSSEHDVQHNVNVMIGIVDTVVDFCDEGNVVDRANYYYNKYIDEKAQNSNLSIEDFLDGVNTIVYDQNTMVSDKKIDKNKISVETIIENNDTEFYFFVSYLDAVEVNAVEKVRFIVSALNYEINSKIEVDDGLGGTKTVGKYFKNFTVNVMDLGEEGLPKVDHSKIKIIALFACVGIILAVIATYAVTLFIDRKEMANVNKPSDNLGGEENENK